MVYTDCKIWGPYQGKDGRLRVVIRLTPEKKVTVSYPKYLMEIHLNRYLLEDETVDHIDCNPLNNDIKNLRVLSRSEHAGIDAIRSIGKDFICPMCHKEFHLSGRKTAYSNINRKKGKAGPFCSRECCGSYGSKIRSNLIKKLKVIDHGVEYTTSKQQS